MSDVSAGNETGRCGAYAAAATGGREDTGNAEMGRGPSAENVDGGGTYACGPVPADMMRRCGRGGTGGLWLRVDPAGVRVERGESRAGGEHRRCGGSGWGKGKSRAEAGDEHPLLGGRGSNGLWGGCHSLSFVLTFNTGFLFLPPTSVP